MHYHIITAPELLCFVFLCCFLCVMFSRVFCAFPLLAFGQNVQLSMAPCGLLDLPARNPIGVYHLERFSAKAREWSGSRQSVWQQWWNPFAKASGVPRGPLAQCGRRCCSMRRLRLMYVSVVRSIVQGVYAQFVGDHSLKNLSHRRSGGWHNSRRGRISCSVCRKQVLLGPQSQGGTGFLESNWP